MYLWSLRDPIVWDVFLHFDFNGGIESGGEKYLFLDIGSFYSCDEAQVGNDSFKHEPNMTSGEEK